MFDLARNRTPLPGVMAFDFGGGRTAAMNEMVLCEMKTHVPTPRTIYGQNILEERARKCLFDRTPLPPGLKALKGRLYEALSIYLAAHRPDLVERRFSHRSWCNHFRPNEGIPWHDHAQTPVVAVYSVKGDGGDLVIADPDDPAVCHRVETPPGRLIFMPGVLRHCSTPHFGPVAPRVSLPVNFYFDDVADLRASPRN